jgi:hypothetical protein
MLGGENLRCSEGRTSDARGENLRCSGGEPPMLGAVRAKFSCVSCEVFREFVRNFQGEQDENLMGGKLEGFHSIGERSVIFSVGPSKLHLIRRPLASLVLLLTRMCRSL